MTQSIIAFATNISISQSETMLRLIVDIAVVNAWIQWRIKRCLVVIYTRSISIPLKVEYSYLWSFLP